MLNGIWNATIRRIQYKRQVQAHENLVSELAVPRTFDEMLRLFIGSRKLRSLYYNSIINHYMERHN